MTPPRARHLLFTLLVCLGAKAAPAADPHSAHLVSGARHFRAGDFAAALVEFRVAQRLGAGPDTGWYVAATLVKLGRTEEALEAFARSAREAPAAKDGLLDFYRALACYDARLYLSADAILADIGARAGPNIAEEARKMRKQISSVFTSEPGKSAVDWYHARAQTALSDKRQDLARAYLHEAAAIGAKRKDQHRVDEAKASLQRLGSSG
jgi:hypothetical protein